MTNRPIINVLVGPPGSGKTTLTDSLQADGFWRVNQDAQGAQHFTVFETALKERANIVVDRMNFSREQRARYIHPAIEAGYDVKITTLFVPADACFDRCSGRKNHPTIKTPEDAVRALDFFFRKFERPTQDEVAACGELLFSWYDEEPRESCIIVDLDGTLCNVDHRLHYIRGAELTRKDWKSFFSALGNDTPNKWCVSLVDAMSRVGKHILFCSGRSIEYAQETQEWLDAHVFTRQYALFMRGVNDYRPDHIVKEQLLDFEILPRYTPLFVVDDRPSVCRMWRERGLTVLQCNDKEF